MAKKNRTFTLQFWLLCLSSYLFFCSFNMIIPELPNYITQLGGAEYKGLIISLFTLTAGLSRPFSGKMTDRWGRIPVMVIGSMVAGVTSLLYPLLSSLAGFFILRLVHGLSTGFKPTGTAAYVADIIPGDKRGEAMGILGVFLSLGMATGPAIGSPIALYFSLNTMFYVSSVLGILSVLVLLGMKESLPKSEGFSFSLFKVSLKEVFEPNVLFPCIIMILSTFSFGMILTIIPDFSTHLGLENKGIFFTYFTLSSIAVRIFAGKASDRYGRVVVLRIAIAALVVATLLLGYANSYLTLVLSAVFFGQASGISSPTIFAWVIDLAKDEHRGRAMSTLYIALEIGIGTGALYSGWAYGNDASNFAYTFWTGSIFAFIALVLLMIRKNLVTSN